MESRQQTEKEIYKWGVSDTGTHSNTVVDFLISVFDFILF